MFASIFSNGTLKMANDPIQFPSPAEGPIGQFRQEGPITWSQMSVAFEGIGEKIIRMAIPFSILLRRSGRSPSGFIPQNFPVLAISSSLAILSSIGGWVLKRERHRLLLTGYNEHVRRGRIGMHGNPFGSCVQFPRALASERGWVRCAPPSSARYSLDREMAI